MRHIYRVLVGTMLGLSCLVASLPALAAEQAPFKYGPDAVPTDSRETTAHWNKARHYKGQMRLEMARQEYILALASCRTDATIQHLQRELQILELQIRSLR